jgi:membrane protease YdiL (CAAX protease family)
MSGILRRHDPETVPATATWSWWEAIVVLVLALGTGHLVRLLLLGTSVTSPAEQVGRRLIPELVWIVVVVSWLRIRRIGWTRAFGRPAQVWPEVADGVVFGWILYGLVTLGVALPVAWLIRLGSDRPVTPPAQLPEGLAPFGWALAATLTLLVAPVAEELLFRGVLFSAIRKRFGLAIGLVGSAVAFGLVHYVPEDPIDVVITVAAATAMGVGLAIQYERRGNLIAPLSAHIAFNVLGLSILLRQ